MKVKIVLFDAVGVLFPANTVVGDDLARRFELSEEQLFVMWKGFYQDYTVGKLTTEQFLDMFANMYSLPRDQVTEDVFIESFNGALAPMPGIQNILAKLSKTDVTLAMLSDTTPMFAHARSKWLFSNYFDHIFLSFEIGHKKPDPQAFQAVIDYYNVSPEEIFFIDDNERNVNAAIRCGMQAVRFEGTETLQKALVQAGIL